MHHELLPFSAQSSEVLAEAMRDTERIAADTTDYGCNPNRLAITQSARRRFLKQIPSVKSRGANQGESMI